MNRYPEAIEIEKKILSAMMLKEGKVIPDVEQILKPDDFYRVEHRLIYRAMLKVFDEGAPPDIFLIEEELERTGDLPRVKHDYLFSLIDYEFTTARAVTFAKVIKEKARLRKLKDLSAEIDEAASTGEKTADELTTHIEDKLSHDALPTEIFASAADVYQELMLDLTTRKKKGVNGLPTGLFSLNRLIGGLHNTDLIILAARPAMGKTALAMNIAAAVAKKSQVLVFSLEMSKSQLIQRLISTFSHVDAVKIFQNSWAEADFERMLSAEADFKSMDLTICDRGGLTLSEIRSRARYLKRKQGLDFLIVDYLQLIQGANEYRGNRVQEVSEISRGLKALAKELDVPILALSQLSRQVEMRAEKKPQLSDLRESGSIEQDADIVMFLYREEYYDPDDADNQKKAELIIAKNRNGATGTALLYFEKKYLLFRDLTTNDL